MQIGSNMRGVVVSFVSQKGGVGKSTLARALAREAAAGDLSVKVADLDVKQGTLVNWQRRRLEASHEPSFSVESFRDVPTALIVRKDYDLLVLDGPARASYATLEIAKASDVVVQPTGASLDDLEPAVLTFHELVREGISKSLLFFALCRVQTEAEVRDCRSYLGQAGYETLEGFLPERSSYRAAQNRGLSVTEIQYPSLRGRAEALVQAIFDSIS